MYVSNHRLWTRGEENGGEERTSEEREKRDEGPGTTRNGYRGTPGSNGIEKRREERGGRKRSEALRRRHEEVKMNQKESEKRKRESEKSVSKINATDKESRIKLIAGGSLSL